METKLSSDRKVRMIRDMDEISYRPEVAEHLRKAMDDILSMYKKDQRVVLYRTFAIYLDRIGDNETSKLLDNAATLIQKGGMLWEEEFEYVKKELSKIHVEGIEDLGNITEASAFRALIPTYEKFMEEFKQGADTSGFSKSEMSMLDSFFIRLKEPLRDANVQCFEWAARCWYDEPGNEGEFRKHMDKTIHFIRENLESSILSAWKGNSDKKKVFYIEDTDASERSKEEDNDICR